MMIDSILLAIGLALILYGIYKYLTKNYDYFVKRNIIHQSPRLILGSTGGLFIKRERVTEFLQRMYYSKPNHKIFGAFDFGKPMYFVRDPEIIKQMAVKDFDYFPDHRLFLDDTFDKLLGNSLIMLRGNKWRDMRATLSPAFTGSKMRQMFDLVGECANDMSEHFKRKLQEGNDLQLLEMKELFSRYTNDVIASSAFGIKVNSFDNPNNDFFIIAKRLMGLNNPKTFLKIITMKILPWLAHALELQIVDGDIIKFIRSMVLDTMEVREKNNIFRPDMINIMMQVKKGSEVLHQQVKYDKENDEGFSTVEESNIGKMVVKREWTDDELVAQCLVFYAAGFDTTATLLAFLSYEIAINPDVQAKLYKEIVETNQRLNGKHIKYDELQKMKYLDQVISEVLRLWPPGMLTDRLCDKDYEYDDGEQKFTIEKGVSFWIPTYALHRDEKYFPNPKKFDPERFSDENKNNIISGTYLPFGIGPRNCIGSHYALVQIKSIVYSLLLNFKFEPTEQTQIPLMLATGWLGTAISEKGIHIRWSLR